MSGRGAARHVAVVVPARDEEDLIADCLHSLHAALTRLRRDHPGTTGEVVVVADRCTDATAAVAAALGAVTVRGDAGRVGAARRLGVAIAHRRALRVGLTARRVWVANTDADTVVPETWLSRQAELAADGLDMVVGTVTPRGLDAARAAQWEAEHVLAEGHSHVHGANLGVRLSAYLAAGGFAELAVGEDCDLVARVRARTARWVATHATSVGTSARATSRVDGGFASYLAALEVGDTTCAS